MTGNCHGCGRKIDSAHDAHFFCTKRGHAVLVCRGCRTKIRRCPVCGGGLSGKRNSYTKRLFTDPGVRGLLGF